MADPRDLTNLADLKAWLDVTTTNDDTLLSALITNASYDFLSRINRDTLTGATSYAETRNGNGGTVMPLKQFPVDSVASVVIDTITIPQATTSLTPGWVFDEFSVMLTGGVYRFNVGLQNVTVTYTAGYSAAPFDVQQAVKTMCAAWYKRRRWTDESAKNVAGENITFRKEDIPPEVQRTIDNYRRRIPV
ncbi:MAG: phage head-tail connector protein [Patescibacteria group bacterium]|nr:phage head-tail connector protein [Patescibacteria group bacterium]